MHPIEKMIVNQLQLKPGDDFGMAFRVNPIVPIEGKFQGVAVEKEKTFLLADLQMGQQGEKTAHTVTDLDDICQVSKISDFKVSSPKLTLS